MTILVDTNYILKYTLGIMLRDKSKCVLESEKDQRIFVKQFYRNLNYMLSNYQNISNVHFAMDSHILWRKEHYPQYKAHRIHKQNFDLEIYKRLVNSIQEELKDHSYKVMKYEADDIISKLVTMIDDNIVIISGDSDIDQLVYFDDNKFVSRYSPKLSDRSHKVHKNFVFDVANNSNNVIQEVDFSFDIFDMPTSGAQQTDAEQLFNIGNLDYIDPNKELLLKIICGDKKSDNIDSSYRKLLSNGKIQNIGDAGKIKVSNLLDMLSKNGNIYSYDDTTIKNIGLAVINLFSGKSDEINQFITTFKENKSLVDLVNNDYITKLEIPLHNKKFEITTYMEMHDIDGNALSYDEI